MAVREILLLGNPKLFEICEPVQEAQLEQIETYHPGPARHTDGFQRKIQCRASYCRAADRCDETGGLHAH